MATETETVRLDLEGMHCASCVARIEKKLNELDGVSATVNLATEQATVRADRDISVDALIAAVESTGYGARPAIAPEGKFFHGTTGDEPTAAPR